MGNGSYTMSAEERVVVQRTQDLIAGAPPEVLTESDRNGMRAFLQRAETRLSTYQRVAGAFLNGAGLLVLLPGLARESVYSVIAFALHTPSLSAKLVFLPWLISTLIPLYAFLLLLRDLVQFYFSPRFLESDPIRITRFSLAGVTLAYDEGPEAKAQVVALKVSDPSYATFILGGTSAKTIERVHKETKAGNAAFPLRLAIMEAIRRGKRDTELNNAERIGIALSLAGSLDLSLVGEVARMETSVCRHVLLLRKLVLRYTKALLLFVWTTLISIGVAALLAEEQGFSTEAKTFAVLLIYAVWCAATIWLIRLPIRWIDKLIPPPQEGQQRPTQKTFRDPDLEEFEVRVTLILSVGALVLLVLAGVLGAQMLGFINK